MKVDIIVPSYRFIDPECDSAIQGMVAHTAGEGLDVRMPRLKGNALIHRVRNDALARVRADCEYVLWCDDDMYPPKDAFLKLLQHKESIVSALCTTRDEWPPRLVPRAWRRDEDRFVAIPADEWPRHMGKLLKGPFGVGFGFVLTSKAFLDEAIAYHLSGRDWLALNLRQLNRLHVRKEYREKERLLIETKRRTLFEERGHLRLFQLSLQDNELERGEDIHLCRIALELGHHVTIDTTTQVPHMGKCPYGPNLVGVNDPAELRVPL